VDSGRTEERALLNGTHRRVKERIQHIRNELPFPLLGIDSDNGGEFINRQLNDRCDQNNLPFIRGVPATKTIIPCGPPVRVEQKHGDVVRKTVGYHRFEGQEMHNALEEVYRYLNPLLNYRYPTIRLIA
jgi:hypothetical protein